MNNLRFNRVEEQGRHIYIDDFTGRRTFEDFEYEGFIKCKLVHNDSYSVVIPDQVYIEFDGQIKWIQPLYFSGNIIGDFGCYYLCDIGIDISHGPCLRVRFRNDELESRLNDGSLLYRCKIKGPANLNLYITGDAQINAGIPSLELFHHTSEEAKKSIINSGVFYSSDWNIQGTKKSKNISYLYLTSLPEIKNTDDLNQIAMSSEGRIAFRVDSNFTNSPDLILDVYRESTENRTCTLSHWVDAELLSTQPCFRHSPPDGYGYHAVVSPFIHRIGVEHGRCVEICGDKLNASDNKLMEYTVVGDATTIDGLGAPYDEEDTPEKLKIEFLTEPDEIMSFWIKNANTNQFDNKPIEIVKFE